jgi:hypothetical protein
MAETVQNNLGYYFDDDVSYMLWRRAWFSDQTIHWTCPVLLFSYFESATLELIRERNAIAWSHCTNKNKNLENGVGKENPCQEKRKKKKPCFLDFLYFFFSLTWLSESACAHLDYIVTNNYIVMGLSFFYFINIDVWISLYISWLIL